MNEFSLDKSRENQHEDQFQRYEFSKRIAKIINGNKIDKSLVIGLYGKWGEGKTSVLNFIEKELDEDNIIIKFNPWLFSNQDNLLQTFFGEVAKGLGAKMKGKKEKIGEFLSNYAGIAGTFTQFVGASTSGLSRYTIMVFDNIAISETILQNFNLVTISNDHNTYFAK